MQDIHGLRTGMLSFIGRLHMSTQATHGGDPPTVNRLLALVRKGMSR